MPSILEILRRHGRLELALAQIVADIIRAAPTGTYAMENRTQGYCNWVHEHHREGALRD